jgi:DNA-directed RNA polymerase subunit RPC12/RpoP
MSTQICPNCKIDNFTWKVDEEESPLTIWDCGNCRYRAFENESDERNCSKCGKKTESKLKDNKKEYWWCSNCNTTEIIKTAPNTV